MAKLPEGMPLEEPKLTVLQFSLLASIFVHTLRPDGSKEPFTWRPKKLMGRTLTPSESASTSARIKVLEKKGLIKRSGREVIVTPAGESSLNINAATYANEGLTEGRLILFRLKMLEAEAHMEAFALAASALSYEAIDPEEKTSVRIVLLTAAKNAGERAARAAERYKEVFDEYAQEWRMRNYY